VTPSPGPTLDVVLHQAQSGFWGAWGPSIVTALASLLVALIALKAALASSERSAKATHSAAERSARSLLEAEDARAVIADRRYLRSLIADVAAAAAERSKLTFRFAVAYSRNAGLWTAENQRRQEEVNGALGRAIALVRLTTKDQQIHEALNDLTQADKSIGAVFGAAGVHLSVSEQQLAAVTHACNGLDTAIAELVARAAERLAEAEGLW